MRWKNGGPLQVYLVIFNETGDIEKVCNTLAAARAYVLPAFKSGYTILTYVQKL